MYNNSTKTPVQNNGTTYQYDTSHSLMKDVGNNIRYYGASPNNYMYFNCSTYSNTNCETWRIIGVFDGKVKIMRNENIGDIAYDNNNEDTYLQSISNNNNTVVVPLSYSKESKEKIIKLLPDVVYGENDYSTSSLRKILNDYYYNSLKYTGVSSYDFTSIGIKNDTTRNMIAEVTWNLGGWNSFSVYPKEIYNYERGTTVYSGRPITWIGKIALAYPSDYGYAVDLSKCHETLYRYGNQTCITNNWMMNIITSSFNWLLTPDSDSTNSVWGISLSGGVFVDNNAYNAYGAVPILYLNSSLSIVSGDGTSSNPYRLSENTDNID